MEIIEHNPNNTKPEFGVLILALGDPIYAEYAVNLAASLRYVQPDIQIGLVYTESALRTISDLQRTLFNYRVHCPMEYYSFQHGICFVKAKLFVNELTPFKKTLFLDADMIFSPYSKPIQAISEYKDRPFTIANRGCHAGTSGFSDWVDIAVIKASFGIDKWYDLSSEWMYFDDSEKTKQIFISAREFYEDDKLLCRGFAGGKPDEPALCLSLLKHDVTPHKVPYYPTYWEPVHKIKPEKEIWNNYHALSLGGKHSTERVMKIYNNMAKVCAYQLKVPTFQDIKTKAKILKERELV